MGISTERQWRQPFIFCSLLLMLAALFTSRILLSAGMIAFLLFTCFHKNILQQLRYFYRHPFLVGISLLFIIPFITWFWSDDKEVWLRWTRIKIPLLLFPVAFAGSWQLTREQWRVIAWFLLFLVFAGCCWSLFHYLQDPLTIQENYLKAKVMATPLGNDHVRFSLLVFFAVVFSVILFISSTSPAEKIVTGALIVFFAIYLHILSARTGLISLYIFFIASLIYSVLSFRNKKWVMAGILMILLMPVAAWYLLPTFHNRFRYILYDFSFIRNQSYLPGSNDGSRVLSLRAGWNILKEHPGGVGSGDVLQSAREWYDIHMPGMNESDKLYPSSEWLLYGDAAGWAGIILFTGIMLMPFFLKTDMRFMWIMVNLISAFSLLFDIGLEAQFGVFIYVFVVLAMWKLVNRQTSNVKYKS